MKSLIVGLGVILLSFSGLFFLIDYYNVELTEQGVKIIANEAAVGAASCYDINEYGEGRVVINDEKAINHVDHILSGRPYKYKLHIFDDSLKYRLYNSENDEWTFSDFSYSSPILPYSISVGSIETEIKEPSIIVEMTRPDNYYRFDFLNKEEVTRASKYVIDRWLYDVDPGEPMTGNLFDGLLAYYPFSENADDYSPNHFHGTVNGATLTPGAAGFGYHFDGNDNINIGDVFDMGTDDMTISAWIRTPAEQTDGLSFFVSKTRSSNLPNRFGVAIEGPGENLGKICVVSSWDHEGYTTYYSDKTVNDEKWHHIVAVFKRAGYLSIFIDGKLDSVHSISAYEDVDVVSDCPVRLGSGTASSGTGDVEWFYGDMDIVRVYDRAVSNYEVAMLYSEGLKTILAWYPFAGDADDKSGNDAHGSAFGAVVADGLKGLCYQFNGIDSYIEIPKKVFEANETITLVVDLSNVSDTQCIIGGLEATGVYYDGESFTMKVPGGQGSVSWSKKNDFVHLAIKRTTLRDYEFFIDGRSIGTVNTKSDESLAVRLVGRASSGQFFNGRIQDLRFYNKALLNSEIRSLAHYYTK